MDAKALLPPSPTREQALEHLAGLSERWHARARHGIEPHPVPPLGDADHVRGEGPLEVIEYGNYLCADCVDARLDFLTAGELLGDRARASFRHFLLTAATLDVALRASEAAEAAAAQGKFDAMHERLLARETQFSDAALLDAARAVGLDLDRFRTELAEGVHVARVVADTEAGMAAGVDGTPTFYVGGERVFGGYEMYELVAVLAEKLDDPDLAEQITARQRADAEAAHAPRHGHRRLLRREAT